ncbi:MAG: AAA family ATPase [Candidatus Asgardarchaeia archaeon]|nr:MAG: hypothetical protein DRO67_04440 [Candidatus Asgardarchaeum californiense]
MSIRDFLQKWGWKENPFNIVPVRDPEILVGHDEELQRLHAAIMFGGDSIVEGPYGAGKTSLLRCLETYTRDTAHPIYFPRPPTTERELVDKIKRTMGIKEDLTFYSLYDQISESDKKVILLVDEAQKMESGIASYLQDFSDLETSVIVYAALDGFYLQKLPEIHRTLYDRIIEVISLRLLTKDEIKEMIRRRIQSVGGVDFEPFSEEAVELIAEHSQGAPREALKICSSAIIKAITTKKTVIDVSLVEEVISRRPSEILNKIKSLGRREKEVMRLFISRPTITNQDVRSELNISSQAAYNILARLMEKELIEPIQSGEGKGNEYAPKELVKRVLTPDIAERILAT